MKKRVKIFGLGPTGSVIARRYAEEGFQVECYEVRNHIAGNLFDYVDENGVLVHKYGPHIFQTSDEEVIEYVKKYSEWIEFRHKVNVVVNDIEVPLPINFKSIEMLFGEEGEGIKTELRKEFPKIEVVFIVDLIRHENKIIREFGNFVYKNVFENYTTKMWGINPKDIDENVLKRVPVRLSYDDGYFTDKFQAVPKEGYTEFIRRILDHQNIKILLNADEKIVEVIDDKIYFNNEIYDGKVVYTGPIDKLFGYKYGKVPYRSLKFEFERKTMPIQERPVVNYPADPTMTRITDYRILALQDKSNLPTTIGREYPGEFDSKSCDFKEPYYPINNLENDGIINKYSNDIKRIENLSVIGRLSEYKYKQMWQSIKDSLNYKL